MIKLLLGILILGFFQVSFGQKPRPRDVFVFDIHHSMWLNQPTEAINIPLNSLGYGFNLFKDIPLAYSPHSFAIGLSYSVTKVHSNLRFHTAELFPDPRGYDVIQVGTSDYRRNKLVTHYVELPVEMRLRTKVRTKFFTYLGFKTSYALRSYERNIISDEKVKFFNVPNLNDFAYGPTVRIGFGAIGLYGFYNVGGLFNNTDMFISLSVGISYLSGR